MIASYGRRSKDNLIGDMFKIYIGFSFVWGYAQLVAGIEGTNSHEQENTLKKVINEGRLNGMVLDSV